MLHQFGYGILPLFLKEDSLEPKRYNRFADHLKKKYNTRIIKISLNAGFTCPNLDGTVSTGGCIYCSNSGSGDFAGCPEDDLVTQFETIKTRMHKKWKTGEYLPYFQAFTNTYAPFEVLKKKYETVLYLPDVIGLDIATRADCLDEKIVDYLGKLVQRYEIWVELGLQTIHNHTAKRINRGHDYATFLEGVAKLRAKNINVSVHIINGLPGESKADMIATAQALNGLDIQGVKIHLLHVLKDTPLANLYQQGQFETLTKEQYIDIVCDQLALLRPDILIQRITGDGGRDQLIAPLWSLKKFELLNGIDWELERRGIKQGDLYQSSQEHS